MNTPVVNQQNVQDVEVNQIATLLIPVNGTFLMVPNVTVAEIFPYQELALQENRPDWWLGLLQWRNREVPIVSYPQLNGDSIIGAPKNMRIAIFNNVTGDERLPFCGIVTDDLPRLMRAMKDEITYDEDAVAGSAELSRVIVNGENMVIPNIEFIQQCVLSNL